VKLKRRYRPTLSEVLLWVVAIAVLFFLICPLAVVIPESFSASDTLQFPPHALSMRWYVDFFTDPSWLAALQLSISLALSVAVLATVMGLLAAIGLVRYIRRGKGVIRTFVLLPLIVPIIVSSIALFAAMARLHFLGTFWGLLLAHTVLAVPFPLIILESALRSIDPNLEDAALSLGASRLQAFYKVTLPMITPSVFGAALFAFMTSWDEVVVALFIGGALLQTLPVYMYQFLTTEYRPTIASASTLLIGGVLVGMILIQAVGSIRRRQRVRYWRELPTR
jgi:ABC-type spermidine/putrescine transport system permease subunit II